MAPNASELDKILERLPDDGIEIEKTPTEFFGPTGQKWMTAMGMPPKRPDIFERWQKQLAKYEGKSLAEVEGMLSSAGNLM